MIRVSMGDTPTDRMRMSLPRRVRMGTVIPGNEAVSDDLGGGWKAVA